MLFQKNIEPHCAYCDRGAPLEDGTVLCPKKGVVAPADSCGSFRYDPLRRTPPKPALLRAGRLSDEEFKL